MVFTTYEAHLIVAAPGELFQEDTRAHRWLSGGVLGDQVAAYETPLDCPVGPAPAEKHDFGEQGEWRKEPEEVRGKVQTEVHRRNR